MQTITHRQYASSIDLNNPNQSWTRLILWTGQNKTVLDVGCGRGQIGQILNQQFNCTVTGIEYNPEFAKDAQGYKSIIIANLEEEALLPSIKHKFDVIICGDILEHLRNPEALLHNFHHLLTPNGRLLISVPNVAQIRIRLMHLRGRWDYTHEGIMDKTHLRWFTLDSLNNMVTACGWKLEDFTYTVGPNFWALLNRLHIQKSWLPANLLATQFLLNLSSAR